MFMYEDETKNKKLYARAAPVICNAGTRDSKLRGTLLFSSVILIFFQYACRTIRPDFRSLPIGIYIDKYVFIVP